MNTSAPKEREKKTLTKRVKWRISVPTCGIQSYRVSANNNTYTHTLQEEITPTTTNDTLTPWQQALQILPPEDFAEFTKMQEQNGTPHCPDPSGYSVLLHA